MTYVSFTLLECRVSDFPLMRSAAACVENTRNARGELFVCTVLVRRRLKRGTTTIGVFVVFEAWKSNLSGVGIKNKLINSHENTGSPYNIFKVIEEKLERVKFEYGEIFSSGLGRGNLRCVGIDAATTTTTTQHGEKSMRGKFKRF